ncbi:hypothetical protein CVT24_011752 [Panaeolus cyanescens]|uniref:Mediator of RNA polymerase II transcription subunit 20 n=1 Tax=Panaeolus cyanescens TaxID=181874 RepID=A0A409VYN0_9AGAR|nr:hypothetical protein CVT24_011752 [Panaeolus cyanescens]
MGVTGLARWINAPATGLPLVKDNLVQNHNAHVIGKWNLSIRSYRSVLGGPVDRNLYTLTIASEDRVFVHIEDPAAHNRSDVLAAAPPGEEAAYLQSPTHFRNTFITLKPMGGLEQLLTQIKARWTPVRQSTSGISQKNLMSGQQVIIDGLVFSIGTDWIVRCGNVNLAGGAVRGMILEAEYVPLPVLRSSMADGTSELLSNLLTSILPNIRDAKTVAVTSSDSQWADILWDREEEVKSFEASNAGPAQEKSDPDDPYNWDNDEVVELKKGDWMGLDRDQRSAFLIMGALRQEGLL